MEIKLTEGPITKSLLLFTLPMLIGNLVQQLYNIADTIIVGRFLGRTALAGVGSAFTLMTFITSILLGLSMGGSAYFSILYGRKDKDGLRNAIFESFSMFTLFSIALNLLIFLLLDDFIKLLNTPKDVAPILREYLLVIFTGIFAVYITNYLSFFLRAIGNSLSPLIALAFSALLNIVLDLFFVVTLNQGVKGAAVATVISQYAAAIALAIYTLIRYREYMPTKRDCYFNKSSISSLLSLSSMTALQQSVMNLGILMVQGIVNSFGTVIMAAFAAGVKIDAFAYMPVQDFGNAYSTFVAQNHGKKDIERIRKGTKSAAIAVALFSILISIVVCIFAPALISIFVSAGDIEVINTGSEYLRAEGIFYIGIGLLFMLYGFYRAIEKPWMSIILTIASLGTRVLLSYTLSPSLGVHMIWLSIPIGWFFADFIGITYSLQIKRKLKSEA